MLLPSLTALPVGVAELQVPAGASWVLLGSFWAADVLNLVVQRLERSIHLNIMLTEVSRGLVGSHIPDRIRALVGLTQTSEGRHVNTRTRGARKTGWSGVSRRTLKGKKKGKM